MRGIEVVLGRQHFVLGAQGQAGVEQAQAHRGRVGECHLSRRHGQETAGGRASFGGQPALVRVQVLDGIRIESAPVPVDRVAHRPRVRREEKRREVDSVAGERELVAHRRPVGEVGRCLDPFDLPQRDGSGGDARPREKPASRQLSHVDLDAASAR